MKLLIYGSNGWIGTQLLQELKKKKIDYIKGRERATNLSQLQNEILSLKPTNVISLIGRTHGKTINNSDYLQDNSKLFENLNDNFYSPVTLAILCEKYSIHFTYFGTGCLYEYNNEHPYGIVETGYTESDIPNFFKSNYSLVKGFTDSVMKLFDNTLNLRLRMCINDKNDSRNVITKLTHYNTINCIPNSYTVLPDFLPIIVELITKNFVGTFNLVNNGLISPNEILQLYRDNVDKSFTWNVSEQTENGRSNCCLDNKKIYALFPNIKNINESILNCLKNYNLK
jgi:dTDP-4-dehydrorhamnose reductase